MKGPCAHRPILIQAFKALRFSLFIYASCQLCHAAIITVPDDHSTIQAAIDAASDGDEIIVSPGTYYENINFNGKDIILRSTNPTSPSIVASTAIDGENTNTVVTFSGTESPSCVLTGFTITNGYVHSSYAYDGAGIYGNGTLATVENNVIYGNSAKRCGGGLYRCNGSIQNNMICSNRAGYGGGLSSCNGIICNNTISSNIARYGGGLYECNGGVQNNLIIENSYTGEDSWGGGLCNCDGTVENNTISGNSASDGGGLYSCTGPIINCIIWGNVASTGGQEHGCSTPFYSCIQDWTGGGRGNISADPKFIDPNNGNYHLQPDSPCINAGNTYYLFGNYIADIDGECRLAGESVDIGSDEYGSSTDNDGDLLADSLETYIGCSLSNADSDADGLQDGLEVLRGTSPCLYNDPAGISIPAQCLSIQQGLFLAFPLEEINLWPGTYHENVHFLGKNLTLQSTDPSNDDVVTSTIIDGSGLFSVIFLAGSEDERSAVKGLSIWDGTGGIYGGGIRGNGALTRIENNKILDNRAAGVSSMGGGLYDCDGIIQYNSISGNSAVSGGGLCYCDGTIQDNTISGNSGAHGGGLYDCNGTIQYNTISANWSGSDGGAARYCDGIIQYNLILGNCASGAPYSGHGGGLSFCNGTIRNNIISENWVIGREESSGGGLYWCDGIIQNNIISGNWIEPFGGFGGGLSDCSGVIQNNTIWGNRSDLYGGGLAYCRGLVTNCIIWANVASVGTQLYECSAPFYSCVQDWTEGGGGNISDDPKLADPSNGDYHLQPDSPCIDAGNTYYLSGDYIVDIDGECRLAGSSVDMGSDEFGASVDSDGDLLSDADEAVEGSNHNNPDSDGDGLRDGGEALRGTDPTVYNGPLGISILTDYSSVQQGIFLAFPREVVTVSPGVYRENLYLMGKNLILQSTNPLDDKVVASTIIDGGGLFSVMLFEGTENESSAVRGLTICNGAKGLFGGICGNGTLATIENNRILSNSAHRYGGGLYRCNGALCNNIVADNSAKYGGGLFGCHGLIEGNIISGNFADNHGGGLFSCNATIQDNIITNNAAVEKGGGLCSCNGTIQRNTISGNSTERAGGGISDCTGTIQNNTIASNSSAEWGGGGLYNCDGIIQSNTICGNLAYNGGGLAHCYGTIQNNIVTSNVAARIGTAYKYQDGGGLYRCYGAIQNNTIWNNQANGSGGGLFDCEESIGNCIIWQNTASLGAQVYDCVPPSYSCIQDWTGGGEGNISSDPQLVDPANGNFHLLPGSPCIDAGAYVEGLAQDFEGDPRPYNGTMEFRGDGSDFDIGADEYTGIIPLKDCDFELTDEGWSSATLPAYFTPPDCYYPPGHIVLTAHDNTNTYGFWTSEADTVPVIADCLYRATWTVATDVTDPLRVPHMQLRVNSQNFQQADMLAVSSAGDGSYAPTPDGQTYEMYFVPPESCLGKPEDQDDLILSFDILNFDPGDAPYGSLMLDRVVIDAIPLETLSTPTLVKTWDFDTDAEGWQLGNAPIFFTPPTSNIASGALWLIAQDNTNTFGFWSGPSEVVQVGAGKLYRLQFAVSTDVTIQDQVPQLRLRAFSEDFQSSIVKIISSVMGAEMSPTPEGHTYDLYFYPPQSLVGTDADSIIPAFDILNFDPADAPDGALLLDSVAVESLDMP